MDLIGPITALDCRLAGDIREETWDQGSVRPQMRKEAMLLQQAFSIPHALVVPLYECRATLSLYDASR